MLLEKRLKINNVSHYFHFQIMMILFVGVLFNSSPIELLNIISNIAVYFLAIYVILYCILLAINDGLKLHSVQLLILFIAYQFIITVLLNFSGLFSIMAQSIIIFGIYQICNYIEKKYLIKGLMLVSLFSIILCIIDLVMMNIAGTLLILGNLNKVGMMSFISLALLLCFNRDSKRKYILIVCCLLISYFSEARTSLLCCLILLVIYFFNFKFIKTKWFIFVVFALCLSFILAYVYLPTTTIGQNLNKYIYSISGKNLFSGREELWLLIIENNIHPIVGYGGNYSLSNLTGSGLSAHNQFLSIWVQYGFIGLILFLAFIVVLWNLALHSHFKRILVAFIISIIIYNNFEVVWIQNHFSISIFIWFIIFTGIFGKEKNRQEFKYE